MILTLVGFCFIIMEIGLLIKDIENFKTRANGQNMHKTKKRRQKILT